MQALNFRTGMVLVLVASAVLVVSALVLGVALANSEAATGDGARSSVVSDIVKTPGKKAADQAATDVPEAEYRERLARIRQLANEGKYQDLINEGNEIRDIWGGGGGERFAKLILETTSALGLSRIVDEHPEARSLREEYATAALAASDSYGIESELDLVRELRNSSISASYSEPEVLRLRHSSKLWLHLLARLESEKDPSVNLDPNQSLPMHLTPPDDLYSGVIVNPVVKARFEAEVAEHKEKLRKTSYQFQLRNVSELAERLGTKFLANVYSRPPFSREELETLLSEHPIAESLRRSILKARDDLVPRSSQYAKEPSRPGSNSAPK